MDIATATTAGAFYLLCRRRPFIRALRWRKIFPRTRVGQASCAHCAALNFAYVSTCCARACCRPAAHTHAPPTFTPPRALFYTDLTRRGRHCQLRTRVRMRWWTFGEGSLPPNEAANTIYYTFNWRHSCYSWAAPSPRTGCWRCPPPVTNVTLCLGCPFKTLARACCARAASPRARTAAACARAPPRLTPARHRACLSRLQLNYLPPLCAPATCATVFRATPTNCSLSRTLNLPRAYRRNAAVYAPSTAFARASSVNKRSACVSPWRRKRIPIATITHLPLAARWRNCGY